MFVLLVKDIQPQSKQLRRLTHTDLTPIKHPRPLENLIYTVSTII